MLETVNQMGQSRAKWAGLLLTGLRIKASYGKNARGKRGNEPTTGSRTTLQLFSQGHYSSTILQSKQTFESLIGLAETSDLC